MVVKVKTRVLGVTDKMSKKGNIYSLVGFMDGANYLNCILDEYIDKATITPFAECELTLDIKLGKYTSVKVIGYEEV